jgi:tRNA(adenine34) deaminase
MNGKYRELMDRCFELAEEARTRGDTAVGSLLADTNGNVVTEASERNRTQDIFAHAEFLAILEAVKRLDTDDLAGYTLYTTNEPCFLCSYAIRRTSISCLIYARPISSIGGATSKYPILSAADIEQWRPPPEIMQSEKNPNHKPKNE